MATIGSLGPFQFDMYLPALPALMLFLNTTDTLVQLTVTASLLGMAFGQLTVGPISDAIGRRRPLLIGLGIYILAALACLVATDVTWMIAARFVLGFTAASGFVINNAFIRDIAHGQEASKLYALQASIFSLAPVVAPLVGGQLLMFGDWHIVFIFLTGLGVLVLTLAAINIPESLPKAQRSPLSFKQVFASWAIILKNKTFLWLALCAGFNFGAISVFLAASPFALEKGFGLTPTQYTYVFASITVIMFAANSVNRILLRKFSSITLLRYGMYQALFAVVVLVATQLLNIHSLALTIIGLALFFGSNGFVGANITALAMEENGDRAGAAAGLLGFTMTLFGALSAPLTSVFFGTELFGMTGFMSIMILASVSFVLIGLRAIKTKDAAH